ncbi:sensor histidine kinase [Xylophilus sp. GOD-11R]|uniref:sensor histidine kinase n=1 Tax=Xylophilus sp. GOD-11R TaxID=3089814 RepID=UPI00298CDDE2|nr:ATP-binding protein [Xylophilus sp. GOD-11R]WPB56152.1 ATP-binding protein [Xylophilus sp. GOD-11R]
MTAALPVPPESASAGVAGAREPRRLLLRGSFQQLLLLAFLLIAALLGGISLRAVFTFDGLMGQSRGFAARALQLNAAVQGLGDRSATMERAGRQSLILNDAMLRKRFDEAAREAEGLLDELVPGDVPPDVARRWRDELDDITALFAGPPTTALDREKSMAAEFRELERMTAAVAQEVQRAIEERNRAMATELDDSRARLTRLVIGTIFLAVVLAIALGVWLGRPFKRLERAIVGLGENRLEIPIDIRGPADVRRVGQQLEWLRLRLTELDADKARFLRHISHELKTPLAAMREGVSLLEDGVTGELNENQREVARILQQNTAVLQSQIEALLSFNAAAFEARQLRRQKVDLLNLLEEQIDAQRLQWQSRGLAIKVEGTPQSAQVDAGKMGTALANLLSNAIRFSPRNGTIHVTLQRVDGRIRIEIQDEGPGVQESDRSRIFEPFYRGQVQPKDAARGSGVGLSIVHEYVAAHGGQIALLADGSGAHFRIELPHAL